MHKASLVFFFLISSCNLFSQSKKELKAENSNLLKIIASQNTEITNSKQKLSILDKDSKKLIADNKNLTNRLHRSLDSNSLLLEANYILSKEISDLKALFENKKIDTESINSRNNNLYNDFSKQNAKSNSNSPNSNSRNYSPSINKRSTTYSRRYYSGPRGGCYYINSNGNKSYVPRELCN